MSQRREGAAHSPPGTGLGCSDSPGAAATGEEMEVDSNAEEVGGQPSPGAAAGHHDGPAHKDGATAQAPYDLNVDPALGDPGDETDEVTTAAAPPFCTPCAQPEPLLHGHLHPPLVAGWK